MALLDPLAEIREAWESIWKIQKKAPMMVGIDLSQPGGDAQAVWIHCEQCHRTFELLAGSNNNTVCVHIIESLKSSPVPVCNWPDACEPECIHECHVRKEQND